nr:anti-sigma factor [Pontibacter sp. E15-1]
MEQYAASHAVQPATSLKARLMDQIRAQTAVTTETPLAATQPVRPLYPDTTQEGTPYKWMFAASIALFLISGFMSIRFYSNWQNAEAKLEQAIAMEQTMAQNYQTASYRLDQQSQILQVLRNSDMRSIRLQGVEAHPDANMMVYWNAAEQQVYVDAVQLPAPPTGMQYQLWALLDGNPIDAGMIRMENGNAVAMQPMKGIGAAQAFAVTLEPSGGSASPNLEQLYVMGEVKS